MLNGVAAPASGELLARAMHLGLSSSPMLSKFRREILDLPKTLRETLGECRHEYDRLVRQTRWGEIPIHIVAPGAFHSVGAFGALALESLLDWPVVVWTPADFAAYAMTSIRPRTVVLIISDGLDSPQALEITKGIRMRGGTTMALLSSPEDPLVRASDGVFLVQSGDERVRGIRLPICMQAAVGFIALLTAQALKRNRPQFKTLEEEFARLPDLSEWVSTQLMEAISSLASELAAARNLTILGGGFYYPTAVHAAILLRQVGVSCGGAANATAVSPSSSSMLGGDATLMTLSGSRCRVKSQVRTVLDSARGGGAKILSVTDGSDPEVSRRSMLTLHLPQLSEMTGAILAHAVMAWVACCVAEGRKREP